MLALSVHLASACRLRWFVAALAALLSFGWTPPLLAEPSPTDRAALDHFEKRVRPVLAKHCYRCHSTESGKAEGNLRLDSRDSIRLGGDRGPAVVPHKPAESILLDAVKHVADDLKMPPRAPQLEMSVIADLETWIKEGAIDPREATATRSVSNPADFWAYQPIRDVAVPQVEDSDWPRTFVDHFVLAKLQEKQLSPSPDASPRTLLRRLSYDLIGLPPSLAEIQAFEKSIADRGIEPTLTAKVDEYLASSAYGERWGRIWLDVARYAESSGKEANITFPYAWRYRDYVIDSMNRDVPYSQFITEQIAGDLLPAENPAERARLLIATGFLAIGPKNLDEATPEQFEADVVDEQIDAVSRAFLGCSIACARCHDHKFAPYSMNDYYAMAGFFRSTRTFFGTHVSPANRISGDPLQLPREAEQPILHAGISRERVKKLTEQRAALQEEEQTRRKRAFEAIQNGTDPEKELSITDALRIFWSLGGIEGELERVDDEGKPLPLALGVLDREKIVDAQLFENGDVTHPAQAIPRGFPAFFASRVSAPAIPEGQSGRLALAAWITHPDHPLTSRVIVNRVWRQLFSRGLVASVDLLEPGGDQPSHAELLDKLATTFVKEKGSLKSLVRTLVLSRTYRQGSDFREAPFASDPDNRWLWRYTPKRLDAEAIRDSLLLVSGDLDRKRPVGSLVARKIGDRPVALLGLDPSIPADLDDGLHRSVYLPILRDRLPDVLELFDFAEPSLVTGDRQTTNVPLQSLYFLNSRFVVARAQSMAKLALQNRDDLQSQVSEAIAICFARSAAADELERGVHFVKQAEQLGADRSAAMAAYCQSLVSTAEFRFLE
ncbi:protein of unknown function DUF1549 [Pirellula staleyi DSM 6068]|uniref:Cytochrome c domain-containing protein n=1 Tax=Pirellula staleyi (strain ATCC 27377 / DSM 6068 / ICPB 4128) TaxID=530564 RepID=D2QXR5_PIRSD|nr:PSD1 and planctomycete cytochrome C domain-containing protein [Pirellula staleyi]ADB17992.1 protein of unknown function DUF1549 [Pirellula staleyi DSM 6068]